MQYWSLCFDINSITCLADKLGKIIGYSKNTHFHKNLDKALVYFVNFVMRAMFLWKSKVKKLELVLSWTSEESRSTPNLSTIFNYLIYHYKYNFNNIIDTSHKKMAVVLASRPVSVSVLFFVFFRTQLLASSLLCLSLMLHTGNKFAAQK